MLRLVVTSWLCRRRFAFAFAWVQNRSSGVQPQTLWLEESTARDRSRVSGEFGADSWVCNLFADGKDIRNLLFVKKREIAPTLSRLGMKSWKSDSGDYCIEVVEGTATRLVGLRYPFAA